jgi:hypothetical protein
VRPCGVPGCGEWAFDRERACYYHLKQDQREFDHEPMLRNPVISDEYVAVRRFVRYLWRLHA